MSTFNEVKNQISVREAAQYYGFRPNRAGMIVCPFHNDRHPSCKVDHRFHCFACGADGDVIDFVSKLFELSLWDSATKLATDFGISIIGKSRAAPPIRNKLSDAIQKKSDEKHCLDDLVSYRSKLREWEKAYAPKTEGDEIHSLFFEALNRKSYIDYLIDVMISDSSSARNEIVTAWKGDKIFGVYDSRRNKSTA